LILSALRSAYPGAYIPVAVSHGPRNPLHSRKLTTTLTQLLNGLLNRSPPVVPKTLLPVVLIDCGILAVTEETGAGVLEGRHCDGETGAVADCGGDGAY
jgi:hypothetical protein